MDERDLKAKAQALREALPKESRRSGVPEESGKRLGTIRRSPDEELRIVWDEYEGRPYLSLRFWKKGSNGVFYPEKARGFTVRVRELADFAEAIEAALEEADEYFSSPRPKSRASTPSRRLTVDDDKGTSTAWRDDPQTQPQPERRERQSEAPAKKTPAFDDDDSDLF